MNAADLATCFWKECAVELYALEEHHGLSALSGLVEYYNGHHIITPYDSNKRLDYPFHVTARYEGHDTCVEILW